ncbi:hypothetical protein FSP39_013027, partial [Pinctada imbricata]
IFRLNSPEHTKRWNDVKTAIDKTGTYELTTEELTFGAKTAWRNAPRCIGRIQWSKLQIENITLSTFISGNNMFLTRSAITIFPPRTDGSRDYRVFNTQLIRYAGYRQKDGSVIGDPASAEFTEFCLSLGWKGRRGMFDVLPLVLQADGKKPELFDIPSDIILEVNIKHPKFPRLSDMNLKWFALPAVSNMMFDCGGLEFCAAPFSGWYMETEIGVRDFCDSQRYNLVEKIAEKMDFDTKDTSSLWKDKAAVEMNVAVLHSFQEKGVTITDHHSASESFMTFLENEQEVRGGCPADWVWIVPPISGSLTEVFHQEMMVYKLKPSYEYQDEPWRAYSFGKKTKRARKMGFHSLSIAIKVIIRLMRALLSLRKKCVILYATETGRSARYAKQLLRIFENGFNAKVVCMADYDIRNIRFQDLVLVVTSTFGNGDPPENGKAGQDGGKSETKEKDKNAYTNISYSVFGLGSRAYPHFCAFAQYIDKTFEAIGLQRISNIALGDELSGQEDSFRRWSQTVFKDACETFQVSETEGNTEIPEADVLWSPGKFKHSFIEQTEEPLLTESLSKLHNRTVLSCELVQRKQLQSRTSDRQTILVKLDTSGRSELRYSPGDHVAIYPANSGKIVDGIINHLKDPSAADKLIQVYVSRRREGQNDSTEEWGDFKKLPLCSVKTALTRFLDITTPPSIDFLKAMALQPGSRKDIALLENLSNDAQSYEEWKLVKDPNILELLETFPSIRLDPTLLLTQLPILQQRYYSISSSPKAYPREIHATIAVLKYNTMGGTGPQHNGVCSSWLNSCDIGESIPCAIREAPLFHLPEDATLPIIMVGTGTGIAPFRSFWQQRQVDRETLPSPFGNTKRWGDMDIYFGCRQSTVDNIYGAELDVCKNDRVFSEVNVALSREPGVKKTYVQDMILKNEDRIYHQLMRKGGHFYVCGDVIMASEVESTLEQILQNKGNMSTEDAAKCLSDLKVK